MVVGGFNSEKGLISDVEVISAKPSNVCSKFVRPIFGKVSKSKCNMGSKKSFVVKSFLFLQAFQFPDGFIANEADMLGHIGVFTKDAPRVCGGKNTFGLLTTCYEFNSITNRFQNEVNLNNITYQ